MAAAAAADSQTEAADPTDRLAAETRAMTCLSPERQARPAVAALAERAAPLAVVE